MKKTVHLLAAVKRLIVFPGLFILIPANLFLMSLNLRDGLRRQHVRERLA